MSETRLQTILDDFARATAVRPPCEARIDPDTCVVCTAWTTESLEAGVRLWGQARAPGTIRTLAAEVLRLRERVARADSDAAGYLADHAAAMLDLAAATARAEKAEAERDALRAAAQKYCDAVDACHILEDDARDVSLQARLMREAVADGWAPEMVRAHMESDLSRARCAVGDARADLDAAFAGGGGR